MTQTALTTTDSPPRPSRIAGTFAALKSRGRVALMPYLTTGYPDLETTIAAVPVMARAGADLIELGMPFSDPLLDGPTIQLTNSTALAGGITPLAVLEVARQTRAAGCEIPLMAMGDFNLIFHYGCERFIAECATAGIDGLIIPNLPAEESAEVAVLCRTYQRDLIMLLAPTSTDARIAAAARAATGFLYCISLAGITGARDQLAEGLADYLARVRQQTDLPLVVGFGISTADHVRQVARHADGAIVASALLARLKEVIDRPVDERLALIETFVRELRD